MNADRLLSVTCFPMNAEPSAPLAPSLVLPKLNSLHVEEQSLGAQYYPLSRNLLQWQLSLKADPQEPESILAKITQASLSLYRM